MTTYQTSTSYASTPHRPLEVRRSHIRKENIQDTRPKDTVPAAVSTLLASTKDLQATMELWSMGKVSDSDVSDVYVAFGHHFNATVSAFGEYGIDLSDILFVPSELRGVLEEYLSEEPSQAVLEQFLPDLRAVLVKLLKGLQGRQRTWRAAVKLDIRERRWSDMDAPRVP